MASLPMNASKPPGTNRDEVYIAAMPLRASKGPAQLLFSAAFSLNVWHLQHFMLILKPPSTSIPPHSNYQGLVFDFQPQDPESIYVALAALSGRPVPGKLPNFQKRDVGTLVYPNQTMVSKQPTTSTAAGRLICTLASMIVAIIPMVWPRS